MTAKTVHYQAFTPQSTNIGGYRYFFNGQEADNEVFGEVANFTAEFWQYDSRLGRRWNLDPLFKAYEGSYSCFGENPVLYADVKGDTLRITTDKGRYLFTLDDGTTTLRVLTAKELYDMGIQWFEPLADNYFPLIKKASNLSSNPSLKHFTWEQVADFSEKDRLMIAYRQGGSGDWKSKKNGADGFFLVTVEGYPYWADAIGQIAFAVDYYTDLYKASGNVYSSIASTIKKGKEYGEGKLIGGEVDNSNTYDNYFLLRGALWASKRYHRTVEKGLFGSKKNELRKNEQCLPEELNKRIRKEDAEKYLK